MNFKNFLRTDRPTDRQTFGTIEAPVPELKKRTSIFLILQIFHGPTDEPTDQQTFGTIEAPVPELKNFTQMDRNFILSLKRLTKQKLASFCQTKVSLRKVIIKGSNRFYTINYLPL